MKSPMKSRMKLRTREKRQSWRMTRRELRKTLKRDARKWVREVWQASAGAAAELEALSPLTAVLGTRLVEDYSASKKLADSELQRALRIVIVAGYGARIVLVDPTNQPALRPPAFHLGQRADAEKIAGDTAAVGRLLDDVRTIARDRWDSVMTLPPEVWKCFVVVALEKLQHQLSTDTLSWQELGHERIETMLRYGYVLCCLDEAIGAEPVVRDQHAEPATEPVENEQSPQAGRRISL
jgi:hypothetical protein